MTTIAIFILAAFAIEHISDIVTNHEDLEERRVYFELAFPSIGKLARCRFCQMLWLSSIAAMLMPEVIASNGDFGLRCLNVILLGLPLHKATLVIQEAFDRFLNRAPLNANVVLHNASERDDVTH